MMQKFGAWTQYAELLQRGAHKTADALDRAVAREASRLATDVKKNLQTSGAHAGQAFRPLAPSTIARKGSDKPLIDSGDMMRSVSAIKKQVFEWFVGIPGDAMGGEKRQNINDYARMHESGGVTKDGRLVLARPWFKPTIDKFGPERKKAVAEAMRRHLLIG